MSSGNSGEQLLKLIVRALWFVIKLIPGLIKLLYKGVKKIIAMVKPKQTVEIEPQPTVETETE